MSRMILNTIRLIFAMFSTKVLQCQRLDCVRNVRPQDTIVGTRLPPVIQTQLKARFSHFVTLDVTPLKNASRACALHIVEASLEKSCAHENTKMRFYERGSCDIEFGIFTVERTEKENQFSVVLSTEKNNTLNFFQSYQLQCLIFSSIPLALIFTIKANQHCQYT